MTITPHFHPTDPPGLRKFMTNLLNGLVERRPELLIVTRIHNPFDHKWLNYSGKKVEKYDTKTYPGIPFVLKPYWNYETTLPPFNPKRVVEGHYYRRPDLEDRERVMTLHRPQGSSENINNFVTDHFNEAVLVWLSTNADDLNRATLLVYDVNNGKVHPWFIKLEKKGTWCVTRTKGISTAHFAAYLRD